MSASSSSLLPDLPVFRGLKPEARSVLAAAPRRRFRRGQTLWSADTDAQGLAVVLDGSVRVVRAPRGRQYGVHTEGPGGTLGEVPFFAGGRYPATAIATAPTTCLWLDRATVARAVVADPEVAFRWLERLAVRVRALVARLDEQTAETVEQRLASYVLARQAEAKGAPFTLGGTQAEAAEDLGTVREVLVRTLRLFRERGLLDSPSRGRFVVRDRERLTRIASI